MARPRADNNDDKPPSLPFDSKEMGKKVKVTNKKENEHKVINFKSKKKNWRETIDIP